MYTNLFSCTLKSSVFRMCSMIKLLLNSALKEIYVRAIMSMVVSLQLHERTNTEANAQKYKEWCKGMGRKKL